MSSLSGNPETEACTEQRPTHVGEGEKQEGPSAVGINGPNGGPSKDEIDQPKSK